MEDMTLQDEWISQILGQSTKKSYAKGMGYFLEFLARALRSKVTRQERRPLLQLKEIWCARDIELELVNAGKGSAVLTKVTEIIPKGFELAEKPEIYRVEDSYLNLKGKRLDPLKTEELKLVLKPTVQGTFSLKPTVLYLDENGKYKSHMPEPVIITVKELGIKGWLKGER